MYDQMDRSAVKAMKKRGISDAQIARELKMDPKTVRHIIELPLDVKPAARARCNAVESHTSEIERWLKNQVC